MRSFSKKMGICFVVVSLLITILLLVDRAAPLFASSRQPPPLLNAGRRADVFLHILQPVGSGGLLPWPGTNQQNNQVTQGNQQIRNQTFFGRNQSNDGNQGFNTGSTQDNSSNRGNLITNQRRNIKFQLNHQVVQPDPAGSTSSNNTLFVGTDQGNSGNNGVNLGNNIDSSGNSGNLVNNQGSVIGTQVNAPGTEVDNDGSVIQHQVIQRSWLPPVHLQVRLFPSPQLALKMGG